MSDRDTGDRQRDAGIVGTAIASSARGNSTAFGFSIMITAVFGALSRLDGSPTILELFLFAVAAALTVAAVEGAVTRGFSDRRGEAPPEVRMLGTAQNAASVAAGIATAVAAGELVDGVFAWPLGAFAASAIYLVVESLEMLVAEIVERHRGISDAEQEKPG